MNNIIDVYALGENINIDEQFNKLNFQKRSYFLNDKISQIHYKNFNDILIVFDLDHERLDIHGNNISMELIFLIILKSKQVFKEVKEERIQRILDKWLEVRGEE